MTVPRELIPYATDDVSALAKSLRSQMTARTKPPSHVEMLNMLARAAGHRNFQHLRALAAGLVPRASDAVGAPAQADGALVARAARCFDAQGRLTSWPARRSVQDLCLWAIWSALPRDRLFDERGISALLDTLHLFGNPAIIRRTMCHLGLMSRTVDGRDYRRIERAPTPEAAALIRLLRERARGAVGPQGQGAAETSS